MSMLDEDEQQRIAEVQGRRRMSERSLAVGRWSDGPRASKSALSARNPYHVHVSDYLARMRGGGMPRPEVLGVDSWVHAEGSRTFGFKTAEAADAFRTKWGLWA